MWEGVGVRTELQYNDLHSYCRQCCVFLVLKGCSTGGPGAQLSAGWWLSLLHLISNFSGPQLFWLPTQSGDPRALSAGLSLPHLMATSMDPNSLGGPEGTFALTWLPLPHFVSNSNWSGAPRAPSTWRCFPKHIPSLTPTVHPTVFLLSWLSYIIVQRPLSRPLNPWNGMFDRHQAEITVTQFRGYSLPVHQSMSVSWDFFLVPFC